LETVLENSLFLKSKTFTSHSNPVFTQKKWKHMSIKNNYIQIFLAVSFAIGQNWILPNVYEQTNRYIHTIE
jgi:hypothetical protein